jgi:hypothetical protein
MKVNISLCLIRHNAMTAYAKMQVQTLYITSPRHEMQCVVSFKPLALYSWIMTLWYPLDIKLGGLGALLDPWTRQKSFAAVRNRTMFLYLYVP